MEAIPGRAGAEHSLGTGVLELLGVSKESKAFALKALEEEGLVEVNRYDCRSPRVKLLKARPGPADLIESPAGGNPPGEKYLRGPVPLHWLRLAGGLGTKALLVGLAYWFLAGLRHGRKEGLELASKALSWFGVDRVAKSRALASLEGAGLISIDRRGHKEIYVTILDVEPEARDMITPLRSPATAPGGEKKEAWAKPWLEKRGEAMAS
jgi:DNA-binding transcriptional ArsR family regulator